MDIKERVVDGVSVLDLAGKIVLGEGDGQIRERIKDLLADGQRKILLNLGEITYIDSAGLGALISSYTTTRREGGQLKLVNLTKRIQDLLAITSSSRCRVRRSYESAAVTAIGSPRGFSLALRW